MLSRLIHRRTIWWPTWPGWLLLLAIFAIPTALWWFRGEAYLSLTERQPADVLVVEGWIRIEGIRAAKAEFKQGGYRYVVATGGLTGEPWDVRRWSYAAEAEEQLLRMGVARDRVILATPKDTEVQRTFESALAVQAALRAKGIQAAGINVFTRGPHARRSRLIFAKVLASTNGVGIIAWAPPGSEHDPWWKSSERADDLLKETAGYWFELLLNSGRRSNVPPPARP